MKKIFTTLVILTSLLVALLMGGLLLPENLHIERSIVVRAPAAQVYPYVSDFRLFNQWSPWAKIDKNIEFRYEGAERGLGAIMHWKSQHEKVGHGSQKIIQASQDKEVKIVLAIEGMNKAYSQFKLSPEQDSTRVLWSFDMYFGFNIPGRIMGFMMIDELIETYDRGLNGMKQILEAEAS